MELEKRIINWLIIGMFMMIDLLIIPIAIYRLFPSEWKAVFGQVDLLAFAGAIIGGGLTLIGVRMTLRNQYQREFLNSYPEKKKLGDDISFVLAKTMNELDDSIKEYKYSQVHVIIDAFLKQSDDITMKAAKVSPEVYQCTKHFVITMENWMSIVFNGLELDGYGQPEYRHIDRESQIDFYSILGHWVSSYAKEFRKVTDEYRSLMKLNT